MIVIRELQHIPYAIRKGEGAIDTERERERERERDRGYTRYSS